MHPSYLYISEFTQDVTDIQMGQVAPVILPEMYKIFMANDVSSIKEPLFRIQLLLAFTSVVLHLNCIVFWLMKENLNFESTKI